MSPEEFRDQLKKTIGRFELAHAFLEPEEQEIFDRYQTTLGEIYREWGSPSGSSVDFTKIQRDLAVIEAQNRVPGSKAVWDKLRDLSGDFRDAATGN